MSAFRHSYELIHRIELIDVVGKHEEPYQKIVNDQRLAENKNIFLDVMLFNYLKQQNDR